MRRATSFILTGVNLACFSAIAISFLVRGAKLPAPWDGPALATVALTAATVCLAAVAIGVAMLTIWGYTTLREHAANIADRVAREIAEQIASAAVQAWLDREERPWATVPPMGESVADAYKDAQV